MSEADRLCRFIANASNICLITHTKADGDTLGSAFALKSAFPEKKITTVSLDNPPRFFEEILGKDKIERDLPIDADFDLYMMLDCCQLNRTGFGEKLRQIAKRKPLVAIDHHLNRPSRLLKHCWLDSSYNSTAEMVFECLNIMHRPISKEIATALLLGLYTDTCAFKCPRNPASALQTSARLVSLKGDLKSINQSLQPYRSIIKTKLWGMILTRLRFHPLGIAWTVITKRILRQIGAETEDINGISTIIGQSEGTKLVIIFIETDQGFLARFRSNFNGLRLKKLAEIFDGFATQKSGYFFTTKSIFSGKI